MQQNKEYCSSVWSTTKWVAHELTLLQEILVDEMFEFLKTNRKLSR